MNTEKLIDLVRQYPVLYDLSDVKYMDSAYKFNIWSIIAKEMKEDVTSCKSRWNNIRDNYRKSIKKTTAQSLKKVKRYRYSEQLDFLKIYFKEGDIKGNIESQEGEDESEDEDRQRNDDHENIGAKRKNDGKSSTVLVDDEVMLNQLSPALNNTKSSEAKFINDKTPLPTSSSKLMGYENDSSTAKHHSVDAFLLGISATLKTFPPYLLNLAKSEIFATVQKYELEMIMDQHQKSSSHNINHNIGHYSNISSVASTPMSPSEASSTVILDAITVKDEYQ